MFMPLKLFEIQFHVIIEWIPERITNGNFFMVDEDAFFPY
jgi:hypothetical protein